MKCLIIQIQPQRDTRHSVNELAALSRTIGRYPEVEPDYEHPEFTNLNYFTEHLPTLWAELQQKLFADSPLSSWLKQVAVVICEGEYGWSDALLLQHFDASEELDSL